MKKSTWNTYYTGGYSHDVANNQASQGGVHLHQVRRKKGGFWQKRICQSNGRHEAYGPVTAITEDEGEAFFATAQMEDLR